MPTVRDILIKKGCQVHTISKEATVVDAARRMNEQRIGALCVVEGGAIVGMFTERDVLNRIVAGRRDPATTTVAEVMTSPVVTSKADAKLAECAAMMSSRKIRHLPIVEVDGSVSKLVGMISTGDLMALDVAQKQDQIDHLHDYLHGRS